MKIFAAMIMSMVLFIPLAEAKVGGSSITPDKLASFRYTYTVEKTDLGDRVALVITAKPTRPYDKVFEIEKVEGRLSIGHHDSIIVYKEVKDSGTLVFKFNMAKNDLNNSRLFVGYTDTFDGDKITAGYLDVIELKFF